MNDGSVMPSFRPNTRTSRPSTRASPPGRVNQRTPRSCWTRLMAPATGGTYQRITGLGPADAVAIRWSPLIHTVPPVSVMMETTRPNGSPSRSG